MKTPEGRADRFVFDFEICRGVDGLRDALQTINFCGYAVISVTQNGPEYTVVFRRCVS